MQNDNIIPIIHELRNTESNKTMHTKSWFITNHTLKKKKILNTKYNITSLRKYIVSSKLSVPNTRVVTAIILGTETKKQTNKTLIPNTSTPQFEIKQRKKQNKSN